MPVDPAFEQARQSVYGQSDQQPSSSAWDEAYNQATGQVTPQSSASDAQDQTQGVQQPARHTLDKKALAEQADTEANGEQSPSLGDYAMDIPIGVAAGVESFGKSLGRLTNDLYGAIAGKGFTDDSTFDNSIHTKTWVGALTSGITQFALAFVPAVGIAGRVGEAVGITSKLATSLAGGALADFAGFSEKQGRLSDLLNQVPAIKDSALTFLASKPDDSWAEARLKNAIEGLGVGVASHVLFEGLKGMRGMMAAKTAGDAAGFAKASAEASQNVTKALQVADAAKPSTATEAAAGAIADATGGVAATTPPLRNGVPDGLADKIIDHIRANPDKPFEVALDDAVQTHVNYGRLETTADVTGLQKLAQNVADKYVSDLVDSPMKLAAVKDTADELAQTFNANPKLLWSSLAADENGVSGVATKLVSYRIMRNTLGQGLVNAAEQWLGQLGTASAADALDRVSTLSKSYLDLHASIQSIQTEGARITSFGRVLAGTTGEADADRLAKLVEQTMQGGNGKLAQQQLARTIVASKGDPKSLLTLFNGLADNIGKKVVNPLVEYHTNAVLSGLATQATKFLSDLTNAVVLPTERLLGGAWMQNKAVMQSGGRMYLNIITSLLDWTHLSEGASRISEQQGSSMGRAFHAFVSGQPILDHLSDFQPQHAISAGNLGLSQGSWLGSAVNLIGNIVNFPQRMLMGTDELFKQVNFRAYVRDEGIRLAQGQGLQGEEFANFVNNHIDRAFGPNGQSLNNAALNYAKAATFQNDLLDGTMGKWLQDGANQHPALRLIMPFVRTPTNIFRRAWQLTPGLNMLQQEFRNMVLSSDPIERATAYGRASLGGMLWTLAIGMASSGKLTGGGPSNANQRSIQQDSGWQPYSIVTTDAQGNKTYVSLKRLEPFANMLGLAADWHEAAGQMNDDDGDKTATAMLYTMAHNLTSKSYFSGLTELLNAMSQPDEKLQSFINNFAGSFVPAALAKANNDPYERDCQTMMDAMRRRIPGLSESLPPVRNILGEPVQVPGGWLPFGGDQTDTARMLSPFAESKQIPDDVHQELAKLQYGFAKAPRNLQGFDLTAFHNQEGQDAYDRYQQLTGETKIGGQTMAESLGRLVKSQRYQAMEAPTQHGDDSNPRVMAVRQLIADYRQRSMQQVLTEYPQIGRAMQAYRQQQKGAATPSPVMQALGQR